MEEFDKQELNEMQDVYTELIEIKVAALRELASKMSMKDFFYITFEDGAGQLFSEGTTISNGYEWEVSVEIAKREKDDMIYVPRQSILTIDEELTNLRATVERLTKELENNIDIDYEHAAVAWNAERDAERKRIAEEVASFADDCLMGAALNELNRLAGNIARGDFIPNKSKEKS